jgi:Na+-driven multidrug efflux pump
MRRVQKNVKRARTKLKLTMKYMKGMKFFYSSFFMVFMPFIVEHFLAQDARRCLSRYFVRR